MLALGYDKLCGNRAAFEASLFLTLSRSWCISWSILKAGSASLPCLTLLNTPNCCLTGYHPQCLLRKYLMTSARFLSPTQQVRLLGTNRILISRTCCLYGGGWPQKGNEHVIWVGRWDHILRGYKAVWTHQHREEFLMDSMWGSGPPCVSIVSCWAYQSSPAACPFQLTILGPG